MTVHTFGSYDVLHHIVSLITSNYISQAHPRLNQRGKHERLEYNKQKKRSFLLNIAFNKNTMLIFLFQFNIRTYQNGQSSHQSEKKNNSFSITRTRTYTFLF